MVTWKQDDGDINFGETMILKSSKRVIYISYNRSSIVIRVYKKKILPPKSSLGM